MRITILSANHNIFSGIEIKISIKKLLAVEGEHEFRMIIDHFIFRGGIHIRRNSETHHIFVRVGIT